MIFTLFFDDDTLIEWDTFIKTMSLFDPRWFEYGDSMDIYVGY
jgi:hypothetical protein